VQITPAADTRVRKRGIEMTSLVNDSKRDSEQPSVSQITRA
jgi:hypothetical protein